jgi:hypothetical protein
VKLDENMKPSDFQRALCYNLAKKMSPWRKKVQKQQKVIWKSVEL